jgi:hypothetical protein
MNRNLAPDAKSHINCSNRRSHKGQGILGPSEQLSAFEERIYCKELINPLKL